MALWQRKPQEKEGSYFFSGMFYITSGVQEALSLEEILSICRDLQEFVLKKDGIDLSVPPFQDRFKVEIVA